MAGDGPFFLKKNMGDGMNLWGDFWTILLLILYPDLIWVCVSVAMSHAMSWPWMSSRNGLLIDTFLFKGLVMLYSIQKCVYYWLYNKRTRVFSWYFVLSSTTAKRPMQHLREKMALKCEQAVFCLDVYLLSNLNDSKVLSTKILNK